MAQPPVLPPELPDIGVRVSLRYLRPPGSHPPMGDVVGHLVEATGTSVRIRSADGVVHQCRRADVLYVRRLTDRPVKNSAIRSVEHAAALAWPGTEHCWLDGWFLRAATGGDRSANSAVPLDMFAHVNALPAIIDWYQQRGLAPSLAVPERLLRIPEDRPAQAESRTLVGDLVTGSERDAVVQTDLVQTDVVQTEAPDPDWLALYRDHPQAEPLEVLTAVVDGAVVFASIPGVAVARGSVTEGSDGTRWLGLTALRVAADRRRRGYGRRLCTALHAWGAERGATGVYAQVPSNDTAAFAFFAAVGLAGQHRTRYVDARDVR